MSREKSGSSRDGHELLMKIGLFSTEILTNNFFALDALRERFCENETEKQLVRNIYHNDLRMLRFMRRCMLYENCMSGNPGVENVEMVALLSKFAADMEKNSGGRVVVGTELPARGVLAAVDKNILIPALAILAVGAADRESDDIALKLTESGDRMTVTVSDDGEKLDEDVVNDVIACGSGEPDDFGVGLMTVSAAAASHGGDLKFSFSGGRNRFTVEIPLKISKRLKVESPSADYEDRFGTLQVELCDYFVPGYGGKER